MNKVFTQEQACLLQPEHLVKLECSDYSTFLWQHYYQMLYNLMKQYHGELDCQVFSGIASLISDKDINYISAYCATDKVKEEISSKRQYGRTDFDEDAPDDIMAALWKHPKSNRKFRTALSELIACYQEQIQKANALNNKYLKQKRFYEIKELFKLNDDEFSLFIATVINDTEMCSFRGRSLAAKIIFFSKALQIPQSQFMSLVKSSGKLRRYDCIDKDLDLNNDFTQFLSGLDDKPLSSRYFAELEEDVLPWDFYGTLSEKHGTILKALLRARNQNKGMNILLYGEPGTGKTSFAKSLARELGLKLWGISQSSVQEFNSRYREISDSSPDFRFAALQVCDNQLVKENSMILIDEADEMLRGDMGGLFSFFSSMPNAGDKGMLNSILDKVKTPCIWISNTNNNDLDPSSRRRFDYSIKFGKMSMMQRKNIWNNSVCKHEVKNYFSAELITSLAEKYEVSAGGIDITVSNIAGIIKNDSIHANQIEILVDKLIAPHCELLDIKPQKTDNINSTYSLEGLNVRGRIKPAQIINAAKRFRREREESLDISPDQPRMNILLTGVPGTGKTEFVKYLGKNLDCQVLTKMASDLLDMYVGGTEKNIRHAFKEAEENNAILFIDEADGMFRSREVSKRSWEVTQVNELLHAMENFNGILICATNFAQNLDKATIRRFTFKLEFDYLNSTDKELFFKKFFSHLTSSKLKRQHKQRLDAISNLTPGDFRTVRQSLYYLGSDNISHETLLTALEEESQSKTVFTGQKSIGFN